MRSTLEKQRSLDELVGAMTVAELCGRTAVPIEVLVEYCLGEGRPSRDATPRHAGRRSSSVRGHVRRGPLSSMERLALERLQPYLDGEDEVSWILGRDPAPLRRFARVGRKTVEALQAIRRRLEAALEAGDPTSVIVPLDSELDDAALDAALVEDIESFMETLEAREREILIRRWGLDGAAIESLLEIGDRFGVTRERVRQLQRRCEDALSMSVSCPRSQIFRRVEGRTEEELRRRFVRLSALAPARPTLCALLEALCGQALPELREPTSDDLARDLSEHLLDDFFAENAAPAPRGHAIAHLVEHCGLEEAVADAWISLGASRGWLHVDGHTVTPTRLPLVRACAHVMVDRPEGAHWSRILQFVKERGLRRRLLMTRPSGVIPNPYLYYVGDGRYRHLRYLSLSPAEQQRALRALASAMRGQERESLERLHQRLQPAMPDLDYYELRHVVSTRAEEIGLHFDGASRRDQVSVS